MAAWIWQQYFQENPFSRQSGEKFRQGFLAHGGSKPPHEMVASFLGKDTGWVSLKDRLHAHIEKQRFQ